MEYVFGKRLYNGQETEFVKVITDNDYANFQDGRFVTYTFDNDTITITHTFRILFEYKRNIDLQGKYQVWYYIDNHVKETNFNKTINETITTHTAQLQEQSTILDDILVELLTGGVTENV